MGDVIDGQFELARALVTNLLVNNRNFASDYYATNTPSTRDFIRHVLPRWHEGITDRLDELQALVKREMPEHDAGPMISVAKVKDLLALHREALADFAPASIALAQLDAALNEMVGAPANAADGVKPSQPAAPSLDL
jgi:hypothetical protein